MSGDIWNHFDRICYHGIIHVWDVPRVDDIYIIRACYAQSKVYMTLSCVRMMLWKNSFDRAYISYLCDVPRVDQIVTSCFAYDIVYVYDMHMILNIT